MPIFILSSFFFHLIGNVFTFPDVCNPIECFHILDTFFQPSYSEESCEKITKLEKCVRLCTTNKADNFFLKGLHEVKEDLCKIGQRIDLENKCENKHKFSLISCIYEAFHLEAEDANTNTNLLMCRQAYDGEFCYRDSLPLCSDHEGYLSSVLLLKLFQPLRNKSCGLFSNRDVYDVLKLKPLARMKDYTNLAECLDVNSPYVTDCIPKKWIATNIQQKSMLCSDAQSFFNCVEKVVESKCDNSQKNVFSSIRQPVFLYMLPHCTGKQNGALPLKSTETSDKILNEVYTDPASADAPSQNASEIVIMHGLNKVYSDPSPTSTVSPPNASEVVVVHQHVIITMTYKEKNAANQIYVCYYLIALAILFGIGKEL